MQEITPYRLVPKNLDEAMNFSRMIAASDFAPKDYKGKPGNVLVACQMGADVGLSPMQAIQNIAVINGRPCIWGDAALAITMNSPMYEYHKETFEFDSNNNVIAAICIVKRRDSEEYEYRFSVEDAKKAQLWGKSGPWTQYPKRMLQMRARSFALRDKFSDALKGLSVREEVEDYQPIKNENNNNKISPTQEFIPLEKKQEEIIFDLSSAIETIKSSSNPDELKQNYERFYRDRVKYHDKESLDKIIKAKDERKEELNLSSSNETEIKKQQVEEFLSELKEAEEKELENL